MATVMKYFNYMWLKAGPPWKRAKEIPIYDQSESSQDLKLIRSNDRIEYAHACAYLGKVAVGSRQ